MTALPTMALTLGTPGFWPMDPASGLDWRRILHGEQSLRLYLPIDVEGDIVGTTVIEGLRDQDLGRLAMIRCSRELVDGATGEPIASLEEVRVLRGGGGSDGEDVALTPKLPPVPARPSDAQLNLPTTVNQAALYRLTGDRNPLHIDAATARAADFERPILHGLATMGLLHENTAYYFYPAGGETPRELPQLLTLGLLPNCY